jgi:hypothetical protein
MNTKAISEDQLRERLSATMSQDQIDALIDRYDEASLEETPNMSVISDLAEKNREDKLLRVSFKLTSEQYTALETYFEEPQRPATLLVQRAIKEFIDLAAA